MEHNRPYILYENGKVTPIKVYSGERAYVVYQIVKGSKQISYSLLRYFNNDLRLF